MIKDQEKKIRIYFMENHNATLDDASRFFKIPKSTIQAFCGREANRKLYIVASVIEGNLYFVFNGINERELITNSQKEVVNDFCFSELEKIQIKKYGFKF